MSLTAMAMVRQMIKDRRKYLDGQIATWTLEAIGALEDAEFDEDVIRELVTVDAVLAVSGYRCDVATITRLDRLEELFAASGIKPGDPFWSESFVLVVQRTLEAYYD